MSPAELATTSDTLAWLAVLSYVVAAALFGLEFAYGTRWFGAAGLTVTVAGLAANVGAAVTRGLAVDRVPWGNMYEFSIIVGIITVAGFLLWLRRRPEVRPSGCSCCSRPCSPWPWAAWSSGSRPARSCRRSTPAGS